MKVVVYTPSYNNKQKELLENFAKGIPNAIVRPLNKYEPCDLAVIFGLVKRAYPPTMEKQVILDKHKGDSLLVMESAFVNRGNYYAVGFGGIHGAADFKSAGVTGDRWAAMGVRTKPWQRRPQGPIVVCGQLPRDTNVQDTNHLAWCKKTVKFYKRLNLPVLFRPHPRAKAKIYKVSCPIDTRPMKETLQEARCLVIWNSTSGVDALVEGVPVIACHHTAYSYPVASHKRELDKLRFPSRRKFFAELGYSQWTREEMASGETWKHLMRGLENG